MSPGMGSKAKYLSQADKYSNTVHILSYDERLR